MGFGGIMRLTEFAAAAVGSVVALVGFAGAANASATVDLIWIDTTDTACTDANRRDCPQLGSSISSVAVSDNITLLVMITAGPGGLIGAAVSVDYGNYWSPSVVQFRSFTTPIVLPHNLGTTTHQPPFIDNLNTVASPFAGNGIGLPAGQSAYLGTVSFHSPWSLAGDIVYEIAVGTDGPGGTDGVGRLSDYAEITDTTTFNSAYLSGDSYPPVLCTDAFGHVMEIEVNALRAGGKKVSAGPNQTVDVTAKARILKGTALSDTTLDTTLTIKAVDGTTVIGTNSTAFEAIRLKVGKGGNGAKLAVDVPQCTSGYIEFVATFSGTDEYGDECLGERELRKACK
jgi:hypothetical protein